MRSLFNYVFLVLCVGIVGLTFRGHQRGSSPVVTDGDYASTLSGAISRAYDQKMIDAPDASGFLPERATTRQAASKMLTIFYKNLDSGKGYDPKLPCDFGDVDQSDPSLSPYLLESCQLGIFKGGNGMFYPLKKLTTAEALAVISRISLGGSVDESMTPRWSGYIANATTYHLTNASDQIQIDDQTIISRGEFVSWLYRLRYVLKN